MSERDIVERLDDANTTIEARCRDKQDTHATYAILDAAAEIIRLRNEVARLRGALVEIESGPSVDAICNEWWESSFPWK